MSNSPQPESDIEKELEELGIDNDATGSPDVVMTRATVQVTALVLVALIAGGAILLIF